MSPEPSETSITVADAKQQNTLSENFSKTPWILRMVSQFRALFIKNFLVIIYQWKSNLFTLALTLGLLLVVLMLKLILNAALGDTLKQQSKFIDTVALHNMTYPLQKYQNMLDLQPPVETSLRTGSSDRGSPGPAPSFLFTIQNQTQAQALGYRSPQGPGAGELATIDSARLLKSGRFTPSYISVSSKPEVNILLDDAFRNFSRVPFPFAGAYNIKNYDMTLLDYTVQYDNRSGTYFCNNLYSNFKTNCEGYLTNTMMNDLNNLFIMSKTNNAHGVEGKAIPMPYTQLERNTDLISLIAIFIFPMVLNILLPTFSYNIVLDKVTKVREFSKLMGMRTWIYYVVTFVIDYFMYVIAAFEFAIFCLAADFAVVSGTNWLLVILFLALWGCNLIAFAFLVASVINSTLVASVVGYLLVLFGPLAGILLEQLVFERGNLAYKPLLLIFPFPLTHVLSAQAALCFDDNCPLSYGVIVNNSEILWGLIFMIVDTIVYFILAAYLDAIWPRAYGVRKSPLFCITCCFAPLRRKIQAKKFSSRNHHEKLQDARNTIDLGERNKGLDIHHPDYVDEDVLEEERKVREGECTPDNSVILFEGLKRNFGKKQAVRGLTFAIGQNRKPECIGYLGSNGAGKSTSINMLTGMIAPSGGTAYVNGYDIRHDMDKIHRSIGLCPQFDIYYPLLNCYEHMLFYARIKGVPFSKEKQHVREILEQVGLWTRINKKTGKTEKLYSRKAGALSGGMRRRLSIASALVGNPIIVFMDEPTTGLDSSTKRVLWDCILKAKRNRTIMLVSHDLEECDVLADRISIITAGRLFTVGTSLHLKNKFGKGFKIQINYDPQNHDHAVQYILDNVPSAQITYDFAGTTHFEVPREGFSVGDSFIKFENEKAENGIREFSINQVSLEQIFLNIIASE